LSPIGKLASKLLILLLVALAVKMRPKKTWETLPRSQKLKFFLIPAKTVAEKA